MHQNDHNDDYADIKFMSDTKEQANQEILKVKDYAIKVLRLKCVIENDDYILCKSINEEEMLESFYVERVLIIRGNSNEGRSK